MNDATKLVAGDIAGYNFKNVIINDKAYTMSPPTIRRLAGAAFHLADIRDADSLRGVIATVSEGEKLCRALSWLLTGDESLADELAEGQLDEVIDAISDGFAMLDVGNFIKLSILKKSARSLTAKQK